MATRSTVALPSSDERTLLLQEAAEHVAGEFERQCRQDLINEYRAAQDRRKREKVVVSRVVEEGVRLHEQRISAAKDDIAKYLDATQENPTTPRKEPR